jgi:hypothetical protein
VLLEPNISVPSVPERIVQFTLNVTDCPPKGKLLLTTGLEQKGVLGELGAEVDKCKNENIEKHRIPITIKTSGLPISSPLK